MKNNASRTLTCVLIVLAAGTVIASTAPGADAGLDRIVVQSSELPKGWGFVRSLYAVTVAASDFYENYSSTYASNVGAELAERRFQSFSGPGRGTVFFMRFTNLEEAKRAEAFAKQLIWEGEESTPERPERVFILDSTLVIVSCVNAQMTEQLEKLIRADDRTGGDEQRGKAEQ